MDTTAASSGTASIVLSPGYWFGAGVWDAVRDRLAGHGHRVEAVTLPGLGSVDEPREGVTFDDHVDHLERVVRSLPAPVVVVAHSGSGALATALADRLPLEISRMVYVDSGPSSDGSIPRPDVTADTVEVPTPTFDEFTREQVSLEGLGDDERRTFGELAVPHPAGTLREPLRVHDTRRNDVPSTFVCCSIAGDVVQQLASSGEPMFAAVAQLTDVTFIDLPTGHWPMLSRPHDLADVIAGEASRD